MQPTWPAQLAAQPSGLAHHRNPSVVFLLCQEEQQLRAERTATRGHLLLHRVDASFSPTPRQEAWTTPCRPPLLPWLFSPLPLCSSPEQRAAAVVRCHHAHHAPLASPCSLQTPPPPVTSPRASPERSDAPTRPHRLVFKLRSPEITVAVPSPQAFPEHADRLIVISVSPYFVSP